MELKQMKCTAMTDKNLRGVSVTTELYSARRLVQSQQAQRMHLYVLAFGCVCEQP